jgi:hypothetical protein
VRISVVLRNFDGVQGPRVKSGPDVFADALVPLARAFGAGASIYRFLLESIFGRTASFPPPISIQSAQHCERQRDRGHLAFAFVRNGYHCTKRQGKPTFTIWQKVLQRGHFCNFWNCVQRARLRPVHREP